ncbi:YdhK family protein [Bacillus sp. AFS041924]|uniref:YdhK family protein n=1 Tax=Bacillus sp. AFS041924 TaxID=2033503 RepID=UPI000BFBA61B|nr:YdhK family protein [Bacillus sp. AFS041924]PGS46416.1 hypothetical protein COC46_21015 [Bacillus sp. AFS041924]
MKIKKFIVGVLSLITALVLYGCGNTETKMEHSKMEHSGTSEVPMGLKVAENPTYKIGSKATITEGHMEGMKGAEATIVGAYDTIAYAVTYTPTTGGKKVPNHKWVIREEIKEADNKQFELAEVTLNADHMKGMKGAKATIDSAEHTTVYMIDFKPTNVGKVVKNHKWVTESELSPINK